MKKRPITKTHVVSTSTQIRQKYTRIKLGVDVHAESYRVVRQIDDATPQPAQKMTPEAFLKFARAQLALAGEVHSCYEAGPFGYGLHRALLEMGVKNVVVRPQNWDELGRGVKTDKTDALALVQRLDRYVAGNAKALALVTVPTPAQEQARAVVRHREQLLKARQVAEAQGRSLLLTQGRRLRGPWWRPAAWEELKATLPSWMTDILQNLRLLILCADRRLRQQTARIESQAAPQPKGFGALTSQSLTAEVFDWNRFQNRRQVASLTGLCPGVRASGQKSLSGSITKHGNPRLRRALIELAWRVVQYQPRYAPVLRWRKVLATRQNPGARKKAIVAIGRRLAIDLWRLHTGRSAAAQLQLSP